MHGSALITYTAVRTSTREHVRLFPRVFCGGPHGAILAFPDHAPSWVSGGHFVCVRAHSDGHFYIYDSQNPVLHRVVYRFTDAMIDYILTRRTDHGQCLLYAVVGVALAVPFVVSTMDSMELRADVPYAYAASEILDLVLLPARVPRTPLSLGRPVVAPPVAAQPEMQTASAWTTPTRKHNRKNIQRMTSPTLTPLHSANQFASLSDISLPWTPFCKSPAVERLVPPPAAAAVPCAYDAEPLPLAPCQAAERAMPPLAAAPPPGIASSVPAAPLSKRA